MWINKYISTLSLGFFSILLLSACALQQKGKTVSEEVFETLQKEKKESKEIPDFVSDALKVDSSQIQPSNFLSSRFDVSVKQMPAKTFFLSLIADVGVNVVAHPSVKGTISLELKDVTVEEVLQVVRDVYGYQYRFSNNIYTVYPAELRTQVYPINYIDVKRVGVSDTSVSIGEISSKGGKKDSNGNGSEGNGGGSSQVANILSMANIEGGPEIGGEGISPGSRVQTLNNTDFWSMLKLTISAIIDTKKDGRMVVVNPQSGLVVVTAMPDELNSVRDFLDLAELSVQRQVILETQILEVRLSDGFEAGIDWGSIQGQLTYTNTLSSTTANPIKQGVESFSSVFNVVDVRELLSLLETQGSVQVLSSPRVSTVNNQKALIRVGTDAFFVTGLSNNSSTSATGATTFSPEIELASFFSGISLDVTPQISDTGDVILHVHPIVSDVKDQIKELTVGGDRIELPLAVRDIRESDSIVRARSGQVIVLGGLMQKSSSGLENKQPWLSKVPVLNLLFKYKKNESNKTELVILMRPIVVNDDIWNEEISKLKKQSDFMAEEYRTR